MAKAIGAVKGRPAFMPAPGFAIKTVFGEMGTVVLDGQRAVPQHLQELGFEFKYNTIEAALRELLGDKAAPPAATPAAPEKVVA